MLGLVSVVDRARVKSRESYSFDWARTTERGRSDYWRGVRVWTEFGHAASGCDEMKTAFLAVLMLAGVACIVRAYTAIVGLIPFGAAVQVLGALLGVLVGVYGQPGRKEKRAGLDT